MTSSDAVSNSLVGGTASGSRLSMVGAGVLYGGGRLGIGRRSEDDLAATPSLGIRRRGSPPFLKMCEWQVNLSS